MENSKYVSRWEIMLSLFTDTENVFSQEAKSFINEVKSMQLIHNCDGLRETLTKWIQSLEEGEKADSVMLREKGNQVLKDGKSFFKACKLYTEAIFAAKIPEEAALAHANRGYVLIQKGFFQEAYEDCECALNLGYPNTSAIKIMLRQAECALFLSNPVKLKSCISKLETLNINKSSYSKVSEKLSELREKLENNRNITDPKIKPSSIEKKQILCNSKEKGTHVVCGEKVRRGENIMAENAFAFVPLFKNKNSNYIDYSCHNCAETNIIPFPCNTCRRVSYCSIKCRNLHESIHKFECWAHKKDLFRDIGIAYLALRVLIVGFFDMLLYLVEFSKSSNYSIEKFWETILGFSKIDNVPYAQVTRLSSNLEKMKSEDFLRYALTASMLTCYLRNFTEFFNLIEPFSDIKMSEIDWDIAVSSLLLRHIGQMVCNAHTITGMQLNVEIKDFWKSKNLPNIGTLHMFEPSKLFGAIYPRVSLYNHSCEPNFSNSFNKISLKVKANRDLQVGDEIFNCYGMNFKVVNKVKRKASLKSQYAFDCDCKHCLGDDKEFKRYHTYICTNINCKKKFTPAENNYYWWANPKPSFRFQCPFCGTDFDWHWYQYFDAFTSDIPQISAQKLRQLSTLCELYKKSKKFLLGPHELKQKMATKILQEFIDIAYDKEANKSMINISVDLLNDFEDQYGIHSPEFVYASSYFLDLLALHNIKSVELKAVYSIEKILNSFEILSDKEKTIFKNYFENYVENKLF